MQRNEQLTLAAPCVQEVRVGVRYSCDQVEESLGRIRAGSPALLEQLFHQPCPAAIPQRGYWMGIDGFPRPRLASWKYGLVRAAAENMSK